MTESEEECGAKDGIYLRTFVNSAAAIPTTPPLSVPSRIDYIICPVRRMAVRVPVLAGWLRFPATNSSREATSRVLQGGRRLNRRTTQNQTDSWNIRRRRRPRPPPSLSSCLVIDKYLPIHFISISFFPTAIALLYLRLFIPRSKLVV